MPALGWLSLEGFKRFRWLTERETGLMVDWYRWLQVGGQPNSCIARLRKGEGLRTGVAKFFVVACDTLVTPLGVSKTA